MIGIKHVFHLFNSEASLHVLVHWDTVAGFIVNILTIFLGIDLVIIMQLFQQIIWNYFKSKKCDRTWWTRVQWKYDCTSRVFISLLASEFQRKHHIVVLAIILRYLSCTSSHIHPANTFDEILCNKNVFRTKMYKTFLKRSSKVFLSWNIDEITISVWFSHPSLRSIPNIITAMR